MELERVVKHFYEELDKGKFMGRKCTRCGWVEFPPVYTCSSCGCVETKWYEISGKAKMYDLVLPTGMLDDAVFLGIKPYCHALVELEEGKQFSSIVLGVTEENYPALEEKLRAKQTIPVKVCAIPMDGFSMLAFKLVAE
jgi:uncharacterized OB-fold protein